MPTRPSKRKLSLDFSQRALAIVQIATGQAEPETDPGEGKNPAAVTLGRLGGSKGESLT